MEESNVKIEQHDQRLKTLERDVDELREIANEIADINEVLATLSAEFKHTNERLKRHAKKIEEFENQPRARLQQLITAVTAALVGGLISIIIGAIFS